MISLENLKDRSNELISKYNELNKQRTEIEKNLKFIYDQQLEVEGAYKEISLLIKQNESPDVYKVNNYENTLEEH